MILTVTLHFQNKLKDSEEMEMLSRARVILAHTEIVLCRNNFYRQKKRAYLAALLCIFISFIDLDEFISLFSSVKKIIRFCIFRFRHVSYDSVADHNPVSYNCTSNNRYFICFMVFIQIWCNETVVEHTESLCSRKYGVMPCTYLTIHIHIHMLQISSIMSKSKIQQWN